MKLLCARAAMVLGFLLVVAVLSVVTYAVIRVLLRVMQVDEAASWP